MPDLHSLEECGGEGTKQIQKIVYARETIREYKRLYGPFFDTSVICLEKNIHAAIFML